MAEISLENSEEITESIVELGKLLAQSIEANQKMMEEYNRLFKLLEPIIPKTKG